MVLKNGNQPTGGCQRTVQRGNGAGATIFHTFANVQTASLIFGAVGGGGQLTVATLGRHPSLAVELAGCGRAQIAGSGIDDAVRHLDLAEHFLLHGQQVLMLLVGVLLLGVNEHFHLVELVHADDAGSILASCASLTAVAGAPAAVTQRTVRQVENLVLVHTCKRHFGGADQILLIRFAQTVDFVGMGVEEASAAHHFRTHQRRGDGQREAVLFGLVHSHGEHGDLHTCHLAAQEVEAGTADLHATFHIDAGNATTEGQVILRLETFGCEIADLSNLLDHHVIVFATFRSFRLNHVGELPHGGGVFFGCGVRCGLVFGNLLGEFLGFGNQLGLFVGRSRGDLLADFLLLRTGSLEFLQRGTTNLVGAQHLVDQFDRFATLALGFLNNVSMFTNELDIKHAS